MNIKKIHKIMNKYKNNKNIKFNQQIIIINFYNVINNHIYVIKNLIILIIINIMISFIILVYLSLKIQLIKNLKINLIIKNPFSPSNNQFFKNLLKIYPLPTLILFAFSHPNINYKIQSINQSQHLYPLILFLTLIFKAVTYSQLSKWVLLVDIVAKYEYDLVLSNDVNSLGSTQWFYFSVEGMQPNIDYTFNIVNFTKSDSLFNYGMKPVIYSNSQNCGIHPNDFVEEVHKTTGWFRFGKNVCYYRGQIQRQNNNKCYYVLTFTINWKIAHDKIYLAHSYPYTYTRMVNQMKNIIMQKNIENTKRNVAINLNSSIKRDQGKSNQQNKITLKNGLQIQIIKYGKSLGNRDLLAYFFSVKNANTKKTNSQEAIIIMARQHPGQIQGSYVCEGIINKLLEITTSNQVGFLLSNYLIYLMPMINPDGVDFGNYRTNLSGKDLNRKWNTEQSSTSVNSLTPQVSAVKQFLTNITSNGNVTIRFVLDLHGHSRKFNSFFYGNPCPQSPQSVRIFPYICSRFSEAIQFMDCTFAIEKHKKKAARIHLSSMLKQIHVYTFECSFYGYQNRQGNMIQFTPSQYMKLGAVLINSLYFVLIKDKQKSLKIKEIKNNELKIRNNKQKIFYNNSISIYKKFQIQLKQTNQLLKIGNDNSSGSQSKPQQGQFNNQSIIYQCQQQNYISHQKYPIHLQKIKKQNTDKVQLPYSKFIRVNSLKQTHNNVEDRQRLNKQFRNIRNKKLATISQVNAVPGKYLISLLPIQKITSRSDNPNTIQTQTQHIDINVDCMKIQEIEDKNSLVYVYLNKYNSKKADINQDKSIQCYHTPKVRQHNYKSSKTGQQKKHSQIIAEIEKYRHFRQSLQKEAMNKRRITQAMNLQIQHQNNKRQISTQTIITFKNKINKDYKLLNQFNFIIPKINIEQNDLACQSLIKTQCSDITHILFNDKNNQYQNDDVDSKTQQNSKEMLNVNIQIMKRQCMHFYSNSNTENFVEKQQSKNRSKQKIIKMSH